MTQLAYDTFSQANQSGWNPSSDGQSWTTTGVGTLSIINNIGQLTSNTSDTHVQLGTNTAPDMEILCRVSVSNSNDIVGLQGRFSVSGGNTTCYKFLYYSSGVHINSSIAGGNTNLVNQAFTLSLSTFYWMRFRITSTNLLGKMWQDTTAEPIAWTITTSDSSITGSGGFAVLGNTGTGSNAVTYDHFFVVDYPLSDTITTIDSVKPTILYIPSTTYTITDTSSMSKIASIINYEIYSVRIRTGSVRTIVR